MFYLQLIILFRLSMNFPQLHNGRQMYVGVQETQALFQPQLLMVI